MNEFPILKTERLLLRQIVESDLNDVFRGLSDPRVTMYYAVHFDSLDETKEQIRWFSQLEKYGTGIWWAIESMDGKFIGACGLNNIEENRNKGEIGCWLLPEYWGHGYMAEALSLVCKHAFNALKLHRIEGFVESENINCKKAMAQLDFKYEGTMRDCEIKNGKSISLDVYSKIG